MATHAPRPNPDESGAGGDRDWLKNVKGLPDDLGHDEMHFDRQQLEPLAKPKLDPSTPMGAIEAIGDVAAGIKAQMHDADNETPPNRRGRGWLIAIGITVLVLFVIGGLTLPF